MSSKIVNASSNRFLFVIAEEIQREWKNVYFGAVPYLRAMSQLNGIEEDYGCDSAKSVVLYFLANARGFKGEAARRIKAELKEMVK